MPDFSHYTNYAKNSGFSEVVFGAQAPVLEVELNELQEIINTKMQYLCSFIGTSVFPVNNGGIDFNAETLTLTITNCVVMCNGLFAFIPSASVVLSDENKVAYIRLLRKMVDRYSALKEYGVVSGDPIQNTIMDTRVGVETSRRFITEVSLSASATVPSKPDDEVVEYIKVGTLAGGPSVPGGDPDDSDSETGGGTSTSYRFEFSSLGGSLSETVIEVEKKVEDILSSLTVMQTKVDFNSDIEGVTISNVLTSLTGGDSGS